MRQFSRLLSIAGLACGLALPFAAHSKAETATALSKAALQYSTSGTCTLTTPQGTTVTPCSGTSWVVTLEPGWSARMDLMVHFTYSDDGLLLDRPVAFQNFAAGTANIATHESAAIYARVSGCPFGPCPGLDPTRGYTSGPTDLRIVSIDAHPTSSSGTLTFSTGAFNSAGSFLGPWNAGLFISLEPAVNSVAAIPEPSTWTLMALPLMLGLAHAWRRRGRQALKAPASA